MIERPDGRTFLGIAFLGIVVLSSACVSAGGTGTEPPATPAAAETTEPAADTRAEESAPSAGSTARTVQPGAPGEASRVLDKAEFADVTGLPHTQADIDFMQGMISHHAQAIEMTALIADRTENPGLRLLGRRIEISQRDEIRLMERWLEKRGEATPANHGHGEHGAARHAMMPGMLTTEQMEELAAASGDEFDRLFLEFMIQHHEGALTMVAELFGANGGQEVEVFRFASDVDADQHMEIDRMRQMLESVPGGA